MEAGLALRETGIVREIQHHMLTVVNQYHWSKLVQNIVTTGADAPVGDFHHG
jgi:hypothetical protein